MTPAFPFALVNDVAINPKTDFVARIPAGLRDKASLLREVGVKLRFPYWGGPNWRANWDGFHDWIRDLSWIPNSRILVLHDAAPSVSRKELLIYLEMLLDGMDALAEDGRVLLVGFPEQTRALNEALSGVKR